MKKVVIKGITDGYAIENLGIECKQVFIGSNFRKEKFDRSKYDYVSTGAKVVSRVSTPKGDEITFVISDEDAAKWLQSIIKGFPKRNVVVLDGGQNA